QAIEFADLAGEKGRVAAEAHRPDARLIRFVDDALLEPGEERIFVRVVEQSEQLRFRVLVAGRAIATHADAEDSGAAALSLGLENGIEDRVLDALDGRPAEP